MFVNGPNALFPDYSPEHACGSHMPLSSERYIHNAKASASQLFSRVERRPFNHPSCQLPSQKAVVIGSTLEEEFPRGPSGNARKDH